METLPGISQFLIVGGAAVFAVLVAGRLRLPAVAGLLAAGALIGPAGLGLVHDVHAIESLAEIGVVLLLFTIGLEFSFKRFARIGKLLALGGSLQYGLTVAAAMLVALWAGESIARGAAFGMIIAMSSTAIVLRGLQERGEMDSPHGRFIVGVLIFQDLAVVPVMLTLPLLAHAGEGGLAFALGTALLKAAVLVAAVLFLARLVIPRFFGLVDAARSREAFLLAVLLVCAGTAWLTSLAGLSLALGAFLAGMILADSDFSQRALGDVLPLRELFTSLFFISLGMLFDGRVLLEVPITALLVVALMLFAKGFIATLAAMAMRFPARVAWLAGVGLAQLGEFGFVLLRLGQSNGLVTPAEARLLLAAGVITMFVTPIAMRAAPHFAAGAALLRPLERLLGARGMDEPSPEHETVRDHVIIAGFGLGGQMLARALKACGVRYLVLDLNADTVRTQRAAGEPLYYGDSTSVETLEHAGLKRARALVLLINDRDAAERAVAAAKSIAPNVPRLVRVHYAIEPPWLRKAGADDVVAEEIEAAVEITARVLRHSGVPGNVIGEQVTSARAKTDPSARQAELPRRKLAAAAELEQLKIESVLLRAGDHAVGQSPASLRLRSETGALVIAVQRAGQLQEQPNAHDPFDAGDVVFLVGAKPSVQAGIDRLVRGPLKAESKET